MQPTCKTIQERLLKGNYTEKDLEHLDQCSACSLWLQEKVNFRNYQLSLPESQVQRTLNQFCQINLQKILQGEKPKLDCPACQGTWKGLGGYQQICRHPLRLSPALRKTLAGIGKPRKIWKEWLSLAASLFLALTLGALFYLRKPEAVDQTLTWVKTQAKTPYGEAKAYFYSQYGKWWGRLNQSKTSGGAS